MQSEILGRSRSSAVIEGVANVAVIVHLQAKFSPLEFKNHFRKSSEFKEALGNSEFQVTATEVLGELKKKEEEAQRNNKEKNLKYSSVSFSFLSFFFFNSFLEAFLFDGFDLGLLS